MIVFQAVDTERDLDWRACLSSQHEKVGREAGGLVNGTAIGRRQQRYIFIPVQLFFVKNDEIISTNVLLKRSIIPFDARLDGVVLVFDISNNLHMS